MIIPAEYLPREPLADLITALQQCSCDHPVGFHWLVVPAFDAPGVVTLRHTSGVEISYRLTLEGPL